MRLQSCLGEQGKRRLQARAVLAGALIMLASAQAALSAETPVYYSRGEAVRLEPATDYVTVELAKGADSKAVGRELAALGMPSMVAPNEGAILRGLRMVPVLGGPPDAAAQIRQVSGVKQVRKLYRLYESGRIMMVTDRIVVKFQAGLGDAEISKCLSEYGLAKIRKVKGLASAYLVRVLDPEGDAVAVAAKLYKDSRSVYCHPDFLTELVRYQVADPLYPNQWHLNNTGQSGATVDADIDWPEAWAEVSGLTSQGSVRVAINDDSVQRNHEDLADAYVGGWDTFDEDADPTPGLPGEDHGTCVAGVALARLNGIGVVGAAPTAQLLGIRLGLYIYEVNAAEGFTFASTQNADIINNSWGGPYPPSDVLYDAIQQAATTGRNGRGMVILFAAGNYPSYITDVNAKAALSQVIAIGGSDCFDRRYDDSAFGPELCVVAPTWNYGALGITTTDVMDDPNLGIPTAGYNEGSGTDIFGEPDLLNGSYTQNFGGTSSATPLVAGVCALILRANPTLTNEQVRRILEHSADQIDSVAAGYGAVSGHSLLYGYGRVNAYKAVVAAKAASGGSSYPPPVTELRQLGSSTINLSWKNPSEEVASVMVIHSNSPITWLPSGIRNKTPTNYTVGQFVAPGVEVVSNTIGESFQDDPGIGIHYYAVFVRNEPSRWSWGESVMAPLGKKSAPKASVSATPKIGASPLTVTFSGGALDPDLENIEFDYTWDFGDGSSASGQPYATHEYKNAGTYMATLTATDVSGLIGTAMVRIQVSSKPNQPPVARIALSPGDGPAPHTVRLQAVASDVDGTITQYGWDFGDGTFAAGQIVEHTYTQPGAYAVTLEVIDDQAMSAKATVAVSVWDDTGGIPKPTGGTTDGTTTQLCGTCGSAGLPTLVASMLGWGLLTLRRRRR
ncbi:MAG: S8 family serine peptidase [Phycisphaerae bacterium]|nr:S8 family serine peptidase [Phycisphaerae bacterium]